MEEFKHIGNLKPAEGSKFKKKRIGRGPGSGHGGTATKGHKGAQSRSGYKTKMGFEGGQMPLHRRVPKFGFFNRFRVEYQVINLDRIQEMYDNDQIEDNKIDFEFLLENNLISKSRMPLKILGTGEIKVPLTIVAHKFSNTAKQKIESVGGKAQIHE